MTENSKIPEEFRGPFGGIDEQAVNDALEDMVGIERSFRLMNIWRDCHMHARGRGDIGANFMEKRSRYEITKTSFCKRAENEGFPAKAIEHYITYFT